MENKINIIRKSEYKMSEWSGGTTTELLIYPYETKYIDRNFKWRLSSAKVEVEESEFTYLSGFSRIIMILEGNLTLKHQDHYEKILTPFQQDSFMGHWHTKSYGKATDFNLMLSKDCEGKLEPLSLKSQETYNMVFDEYESFKNSDKFKKLTYIFYNLSGDLNIKIGGKSFALRSKELMDVTMVTNAGKPNIEFYNASEKEARIIKAVILY